MPYESNTMQARALHTSSEMYRPRPLGRSTAPGGVDRRHPRAQYRKRYCSFVKTARLVRLTSVVKKNRSSIPSPFVSRSICSVC